MVRLSDRIAPFSNWSVRLVPTVAVSHGCAGKDTATIYRADLALSTIEGEARTVTKDGVIGG